MGYTYREASNYDIYSLLQDRSNSSALLARLGNIYDLVQNRNNSSALAMELLQPCTKPSIYRKPVCW